MLLPTNAHDFYHLCFSYFYNESGINVKNFQPWLGRMHTYRAWRRTKLTLVFASLTLWRWWHIHIILYVSELWRVCAHAVVCVFCKNQEELCIKCSGCYVDLCIDKYFKMYYFYIIFCIKTKSELWSVLIAIKKRKKNSLRKINTALFSVYAVSRDFLSSATHLFLVNLVLIFIYN